MNDTRQRITALALIYRALYQGPDLKRVDLRTFHYGEWLRERDLACRAASTADAECLAERMRTRIRYLHNRIDEKT